MRLPELITLNSTTRRFSNQETPAVIAPGQSLALASKSPRRVSILETFGFRVIVVPSTFDEATLPQDMDPEDYVVSAARGKALGAQHSLPIVAGDTIVSVNGKILGKPGNSAEAETMLRHLSGRSHDVLSAVALRRGDGMVAAADSSRVTFKPLTDEQIKEYIATGEPLEKAGAYAIQGLGSRYIAEFSGSYWNIVGFPIEVFMEMWKV